MGGVALSALLAPCESPESLKVPVTDWFGSTFNGIIAGGPFPGLSKSIPCLKNSQASIADSKNE